MTPLEITWVNIVSSLYDAARIIICASIVALSILGQEYARTHCWFGHSYRLKHARNDNGMWIAEGECERCGRKITEITDTAHFRIGR